jgi:LPS export ABC transporter protein LptC
MKILMITLGCALLLVMGCGEEKVKPTVTQLQQQSLPAQESWNSTVVFTDSAQVKAVLWSGHIAMYSTEHITLLDDSVRVDFFDEQGRHTSRLTAHRGKVDDQTHDLEAYENVMVLSDSGTTLKTDRLFWDNATRKTHTDAFVDIVSPREHIMGHGMESDQALKNYRIFKVTGQALTNE